MPDDAQHLDSADTESLTVDDLHVVEPRAAGLDVHKMCITAAVRLYEAATGAAHAVVQEFSALPDGLRAITDWLQTIPGIDFGSACTILAELGPNLEAFREARHLGAWAGVAPGNNTSAGKRRSGRARQGNPTLRTTLAECAHGAVRTKGFQLYDYHRTHAARLGYKRAILATAHKLLRVIHAVLGDDRPYTDPGIDYQRVWSSSATPRGGSACSGSTAS